MTFSTMPTSLEEAKKEILMWRETHRRAAQAKTVPLVMDKQMLWLWKNGDHYLAFDNLYPCFTQGGDPMTLGEPAARAIFRASFAADRGGAL